MTLNTPSILRALTACGTAVLALAGANVHAQDTARVVSSVAILQQVAVPRQVCSTQQVMVEQPRSGAGALLGAVAGGAAGNAIGDGSGRAAATVLGLVGGAILGNKIEGAPAPRMQEQTTCTTQTIYENRTVGYNVTYEYAGRQYQVQMPQDPGPTIRVQVTPMPPTSRILQAPADGSQVIYSTEPLRPVVTVQAAPVYAYGAYGAYGVSGIYLAPARFGHPRLHHHGHGHRDWR